MANDNKISASISDEDMTEILEALELVETKLPFRVNLTKQERRSTPTVGTERGGMMETFDQEMNAHPDLVPSYVDMPELVIDRALHTKLNIIKARVKELSESIEDTQQVVGSDIYMAYLSFYNNVKQAAKRAVVGADTIFENLRRFFPRGTRVTPPAPPAEE